jgi:integrase/recombinase XerD
MKPVPMEGIEPTRPRGHRILSPEWFLYLSCFALTCVKSVSYSIFMGRPKESWPIIRTRNNKRGQVMSYMVDCGMMNGRRIRFFYKSATEAETKAGLLRIQRENEGESSFGMSAYTLADSRAALALLSPHNVTLKAAAEFYVGNMDVIRESKPVPLIVEELLSAKEQDGRSERYIRDLRNRLEVFAKQFATRPIHEIAANEIDDWLRSLSGGPVNRNNFRRLLSVLFSFAVKRRYALKNPVAQVDVATVEVTKPGILTVDEARGLLESATPDFAPVIALSLFAGLRPESEIWRLDWSHIDLEERTIDVQKSKNVASHRFIRISDNLLAWLKPHAKKRGPLTLENEPYFRRMRETRERAVLKLEKAEIAAENLKTWPSDCLRHTYASCHYAAFKNAADTAEQLGHGGNLRMLFRHYRGRVKEADALAFWQILPSVPSSPRKRRVV